MPTVTVDSEQHTLYYEDTGAPSGVADYTTLIIVHGTAYHSAIFQLILPFAAKYDLRIVLVNRRDYPGSSPYSEQDLALVQKDKDADSVRSFYRARGEEFATFMSWLIDNGSIPPISADGKKGGVALLAWSAGNAYTIPILAYVDEFPVATREKLEPYFRKLILFDASRWTVGSAAHVEGDDPLRDSSMTPEQRAEYFNTWVAGYYTHKSHTSRNVSDLELFKHDPSPPPTTKQFTPSELALLTDFAAVRHSEVVVRDIDKSILADQTRRAFFDEERAKFWPKTSVEVTWCERTAWVMVDAVWWIQTLQEQALEKGVKGRDVRFTMFPEANHFPHWDIPEKTVEFFANVISA